MELNLHLVRLFAAVVAEGGFSRAALVLHVSQPAVTKGVRELERQLGTALLDRTKRIITLTPAGEILYRHARQIMSATRDAELELDQLRGLATGRLHIGASSTIGIYLLPTMLGQFQARYPHVQLFLDIGNTHEIAERLNAATLDVAFVEGPVSKEQFHVTPWRADQLVVIAPAGHPLAGLPAVPVERVLTEPFVLREPGSGSRQVIETALQARGISLTVRMELGSTEAIKQIVAAGLGLAIVSRVTIATEVAMGRLTVLDVPELTLSRTLTRLTIAGRPASHALDALMQLMEEVG